MMYAYGSFLGKGMGSGVSLNTDAFQKRLHSAYLHVSTIAVRATAKVRLR
jgi:hypothetical protein